MQGTQNTNAEVFMPKDHSYTPPQLRADPTCGIREQSYRINPIRDMGQSPFKDVDFAIGMYPLDKWYILNTVGIGATADLKTGGFGLNRIMFLRKDGDDYVGVFGHGHGKVAGCSDWKITSKKSLIDLIFEYNPTRVVTNPVSEAIRKVNLPVAEYMASTKGKQFYIDTGPLIKNRVSDAGLDTNSKMGIYGLITSGSSLPQMLVVVDNFDHFNPPVKITDLARVRALTDILPDYLLSADYIKEGIIQIMSKELDYLRSYSQKMKNAIESDKPLLESAEEVVRIVNTIESKIKQRANGRSNELFSSGLGDPEWQDLLHVIRNSMVNIGGHARRLIKNNLTKDKQTEYAAIVTGDIEGLLRSIDDCRGNI